MTEVTILVRRLKFFFGNLNLNFNFWLKYLCSTKGLFSVTTRNKLDLLPRIRFSTVRSYWHLEGIYIYVLYESTVSTEEKPHKPHGLDEEVQARAL